jgi:hypothetical protein
MDGIMGDSPRTIKLRTRQDAMQPLWGQRFGAAAELPLGAELYVMPVAPAILSPVFVQRTARQCYFVTGPKSPD